MKSPSTMGKKTAIFAAGTALFSDGYQNGVIGSVNTILKRLYPVQYTPQHASTVNSLAFVGTVLGQLSFGYVVDRVGRKHSMMIATAIVFVFAALSAGAYSGGSISGMLTALAVLRFFLGIGIGAEYPAGSVASAENSEAVGVKTTQQHMLFALSTNTAIDFGFVVSAATPLIFLKMFGEDHLRAVWRVSLGFGIVPALLVLIWRSRMPESATFEKESMTRVRTPWWLVFKRYWRSIIGVSLAWFIYDFISYPFGIYSSSIVALIVPNADLSQAFSYNILINAFYIPGTVIGALVVDRFGPRRLMTTMLVVQAIVGFGMSGGYANLTRNVAGFAVIYGLFLSFGEAGPGNCLGLLAAKSWPTAVRGQLYGLVAAIGKVGAFAGTYAFPRIIAAFPAGDAQASGPFFVGSGLAILSALITWFLIPEVEANHMQHEDAKFRAYLEENGFDTTQMGLVDSASSSFVENGSPIEDDKILSEKPSL